MSLRERTRPGSWREFPMKPSAKFVTAALLLIGVASTASAQGYWYYGDYGLKQRGYYGSRMMAVPNIAAAAETSTVMVPLRSCV
jgi:hypothetical protein